jgi:hypothetical protein
MLGQLSSITLAFTLNEAFEIAGPRSPGNTFQKMLSLATILILCTVSPVPRWRTCQHHTRDRRPATLTAGSRPASLEHHQWELAPYHGPQPYPNLVPIACSCLSPRIPQTILFRNVDLAAQRTSTCLHPYTSVAREPYLHCRRGARTESDPPSRCST